MHTTPISTTFELVEGNAQFGIKDVDNFDKRIHSDYQADVTSRYLNLVATWVKGGKSCIVLWSRCVIGTVTLYNI